METPHSSPGLAPSRWNPWPVCIVAPDYYEQEVRYQGQIERIQRARQRAQLASVTYDANRKLIRITLPPGQDLGDTAGSIQLYRPSAMAQDRQFKLKPGRDGRQTIQTANLQPGLWEVRVSWTVGRQDYFIDQRVVIGPPAS